ncbi:MAG: SusD/RagB family nutrient-binding outer membrane lipoprotein [Bacteroidia bacterium]
MKKILILVTLTVLLATQGCKKFTEGDKISPNSPSEVTAPLLLSNCEVALFAAYGGGLSRLTSILTQQSAGFTDQAFIYEKYGMVEGDLDNEWQSLYSSGMINTKKLIEKAGTTNPHYAGIAKILQVMMVGAATDLWGDVPYSDALKGEDGKESSRKPFYDKQEAVLNAIQAKLTEAIADLGKSDNVLMPATDDFIFGGNANKWIRTAWMLKARYALRLSKKNSADAYTKTMAALTGAYAAGLTKADDCNMMFGTNANEYNQWYAFTNVDRKGYIRMGAKLVNMMNSMSDPRLPFYCNLEDTTLYIGGPAGEAETITYGNYVSTIGKYYASSDSKLPIITFVEAKFMEAESKINSDKAGAALAYNEAIIAHITKVTGAAPSSAYVLANATETALSITLEKIMNQKYIALFTQLEVYSDWRRTGFPMLTKATGATREIPRRMVNVLEERQYNGNATIVSDMSVPVWWDSN